MPKKNVWLLVLLLCAVQAAKAQENEEEMSVNAQEAEEELEEGPLVQTLNGPVRGFNYKLSTDGRNATDIESANIYLGIPFAQAPINDLRLEKPRPVENWTDVLDALELPTECAVCHPMAGFSFEEDCLFLNIMAPNKTSASKYPVVVFIHGGGFCAGSTTQYGFETVSDNFISQGIVIVTIQYRLGMFGFFSNGDSVLPGNLGLWDQREALVWIKNNIEYFGGDPNSITLWGESAGSASASMHSLSKHSQGLFQKLILHSGSSYAKWASNENVVKTSQVLAKALNCSIDDSEALKECMKGFELDKIMDAAEKFPVTRDDLAFVTYNPRVDGDFFEEDFESLMNKAPPMPILIGYNTHEGICLTIEIPGSLLRISTPLLIDNENITEYNKTTLEEFIKGSGVKLIGSQLSQSQRNRLINETINFYADDWSNETDYTHYLEQYTNLISDLGFIVPAIREAYDRANNNATVYVFEFSHVNSDLGAEMPFNAVSHASEFPYLFGSYLLGTFTMNERDYQAKKVLVNTYVNFIKTGNPSGDNLQWIPLESDKPADVTVLKTTAYIDSQSKTMERVAFWSELDKELGFDVIRGVNKTSELSI